MSYDGNRVGDPYSGHGGVQLSMPPVLDPVSKTSEGRP